MTSARVPVVTASEPGMVLGRATYDELVRSNAMRYQNGSSGFVEIFVQRPVSPALIRERDQALAGLMSGEVSFFAAIGGFAGGVFGALVAYDDGHYRLAVLLVLVALVSAACMSVAGRKEVRHTRAVRAIKEARTVTVLSPVGEAYRRLASAVREVDDQEREHSPDAIASVRLAHQGAREIVGLLHDHHENGTVDSHAARALTVEVYRLASEVDAYLMLHDADTRFAPGQDDALNVLSETSQLTFQPRQIEASEQ